MLDAPADVPVGLRAMADAAALLATTEPLEAALPAVLAALAPAWGGGHCSVWLRHPDGLRLAAGDAHGLEPRRVAAWLQALAPDGTAPAAPDADPRPLLAPLAVTGHTYGALALVPGRALGAADRLLFTTLANLLAPAVAHAERRRRLESEVASRTRQIDEERRFTERIIDSLPFGLYVIDRDFRIQVWNRKRETGLQGVSREEAIGRTIYEILHRQPAAMLRREFEDVFATGRVQHFSMESNSTGELRYYRITKIPMRADDGAVTHVITVGEDVTDWREAQERFAQAEKLAAIGQLAAGVMHEINNPLATIAACAESLGLALDDLRAAGAAVPPESTEYLRIVEGEVQRSKRIVDRLLEFSRPKPLAPEPVDLNATVEQTLFLLKHHSRFKRFTVAVDLAEPAPVARGNGEQLVQVLMALLINAMDAMEDPGRIDLRTVGRRAGGEVAIEVRDHGHGIPRGQLSKVFEPFYTTKAPGRGTGLGLSICYGIVAEHGGRIEVDSVVGEGSSFRILLPAGDA
ncbi:MAG TPA: ATP-binding protein [Gemmatimonadaceae bacterium]|nr:ATP-binding protein [Gemmatimonadaceae bacterium]